MKVHEGYKEHLTYSQYAEPIIVESKLITGLRVQIGERFQCPRCGAKRDGLNHGEEWHCLCGLIMQRWGNGLHIRD